MFKIISLILLGVLWSGLSIAQSDNCSAATVLSVTTDCLTPTAGTTTGATQTIPGCTGNADDDVWYQFVATSGSHQIVVVPSGGMDPVVQLFSGACAALVSLVCKDDALTGVTETINYSGLTIGATYRIRVFDYFIGSGTGDFTICVTLPPPPPINNLCGSPTLLNVNSSCTYTTATTDGATQSYVGCAGNADDDVWFSFTATNSLQNILVSPIDNLDLVFQVYSGSCGSLSSIICVDNTLTGHNEQSDVIGLIPGQTYLVRVYDYYQGNTGDFQICITGTPSPTPTNDEPCNAIHLPAVTSTCQFGQYTTVGATASMGAPTPASCIGGSGAAIGGFSSSSQDVWFSVTVPASGNVDVTVQPNTGAGSIPDGVMALYTGTCSSLTQVVCSDDHSAYPGTSNDLLPLISANGLTPGETVYIRYWGFDSSSGTFGICASTATNDDCANALYICDINGYSASTSASYTPDRPDNMHGNNETQAGVDLLDGTDTGGPFGVGQPWDMSYSFYGSPFLDVNIENNSWIKFTASSTTATLNVEISDCWINKGIQMQIFEANACANFIPVSNFEEDTIGFVLTANGLTVGNDYYLMVDGYAGDICNYTITADSGVQFPEIAPVSPVCPGESITLTAPPGATSYSWAHSGETTQSVVVTPATSQTYTAEVTGLCDYKQTLTVDVVVKPKPNVAISNGTNIAICSGDNVNLTATGATTYVWTTSETSTTINVAPTSLTSYNVIGDLSGCTDTATISVAINALPTLSTNPTAVDAGCGLSDGALNGAVASGTPNFSYSWTDGNNSIGSSANLTNIPVGNYYLTVADGNTCSQTFGPFNVSNPGAPNAPTITVDDNSPCLNGSVNLTGNGVAGASFSWSGPNGFSSTNANITILNFTANEEGDYCLSQMVAGCTGPSTCEEITISPAPSITISAANNDSTICQNEDFTLTANGGVSYAWSGPNAFSGTNSIAIITNATNLNDGLYNVVGTDANGCTNNASIQISILPLPNISVSANNSNATYCNGFSATLNATGANNYTWTGPSGFTATGTPVTLFTLDETGEGFYIVEGTDANSCRNTDSVFVNVITDLSASSSADTSVCPGMKLILYGEGGVSYVWSGPLGFYSEEQNPLVSNDISFAHEGWYTLTIVDTNGCLGYDSTFVEVKNSSYCLDIPNLVTPNDDLYNDAWVVNGLDKFEKAEVSIFNRWGSLIYYSSPYNNDWSGEVNRGAKIDGKDGKVPAGTYFYIINLNDSELEQQIFKGYIEVEY